MEKHFMKMLCSILLILSVTIFVSMAFSSCNDNAGVSQPSSIVGTWKMITSGSSVRYTFNSNGTFIFRPDGDGTVEGRWSYGKDILTLKATKINSTRHGGSWYNEPKIVTSLTKSSMTWMDVDDGYTRMFEREK